MKPNDKVVEVLNDLTRINNDRITGYEKAIKQTPDDDPELKSLFEKMANESREYARELAAEVRKLGDDPSSSNTASGKIYHVWMDIRSSLSGNEEKSVLSLCEFGEDAAQRAYEKALDEKDISISIRQLIMSQKAALRESHDIIKRERDLHKAP